jgi:hypothetical protein
MFYTFGAGIASGVYPADETAHREVDNALEWLRWPVIDLAVSMAKYTKGWCLFTGTPRTVTGIRLACRVS